MASASIVGCDVHAGRGEQPVEDPPVLHVRRQQAQRRRRELGPLHHVAPRELGVGRGEQQVALGVQRHGPHRSGERLAVDVADPDVDLEVGELGDDVARRQRLDRDPHVRVALEERRRDQRRGSEGGRDRGDPEPTRQPVAHARQLAAQLVRAAEDLARPEHDPLPLRREALEAARAPDDLHAEVGLEPPDALRQRGLRRVARGCRPGEVLLARERREVLELSQVHPASIAARHRPPANRERAAERRLSRRSLRR